jgi:hypothetical protein
MRTREWRRFQNKRLKKNRRSYWTGSHWDNDSRRLGILLHTPKICSCYMCGNPRKYFKGKDSNTIQEQRIAQKDLSCDCVS